MKKTYNYVMLRGSNSDPIGWLSITKAQFARLEDMVHMSPSSVLIKDGDNSYRDNAGRQHDFWQIMPFTDLDNIDDEAVYIV